MPTEGLLPGWKSSPREISKGNIRKTFPCWSDQPTHDRGTESWRQRRGSRVELGGLGKPCPSSVHIERIQVWGLDIFVGRAAELWGSLSKLHKAGMLFEEWFTVVFIKKANFVFSETVVYCPGTRYRSQTRRHLTGACHLEGFRCLAWLRSWPDLISRERQQEEGQRVGIQAGFERWQWLVTLEDECQCCSFKWHSSCLHIRVLIQPPRMWEETSEKTDRTRNGKKCVWAGRH